MNRRVLIIGGGFTGLTAAYRLSQRGGCAVELWERSPDLGGLAGGFSLAGTSIEKAYHYLFLSDHHAVRLAEELGLGAALHWSPATNGIYLGGTVHPFNTPWDLLGYRPCPPLDRLRTGLTALYLKHRNDPAPFASHRAADWMARHCGAGAARTIWHPLLRGKFSGYADQVAMDWLWARLNIRARSRSGGGEKFGYFRGGFARVAAALAEAARGRGAQIHTRRSVARLECAGTGLRVTDGDGRAGNYDRVLFTASSRIFAQLLGQMPEAPADYIAQLRAVPYLNALCLVFASEHELPCPFWLNVNEPGAPFVVVVHHTRLVPKEDYGGLNVYYIGTYLEATDPQWTDADDVLIGRWFGYLGRLFPGFDRKQVTEHRLLRLMDAQHVVLPGHARRIPPHATPVPGLYLANFAQIYPEDRGTNFAIRDGEKLAGLLIDSLENSP